MKKIETPPRGAVLAAGLGTRLRPLTHRCPKPLVPMMGRPLIAYALDALSALGVEDIGVNAYHLGDQLHVALADRPERLTVVDEETLQGTGGGVRDIAKAIGSQGTLVVINGDALFDFPLAPVLAAHRDSGAVATLGLRAVPADSPFARVAIDEAGAVWHISEVSRVGRPPAQLRWGAFTGVHVLERRALEAIPSSGGCDIFRTAHRDLMAQPPESGAHVHGVFVDDSCPDPLWLDVGTVDRYLEAHRAILSGRLSTPHLPSPDASGRRIHPEARVHPTARVEGPCWLGAHAEIGAGAHVGPFSAIHDEGVVRPGAHVRRSVVWPGATAAGDHRGAVITGP